MNRSVRFFLGAYALLGVLLVMSQDVAGGWPALVLAILMCACAKGAGTSWRDDGSEAN